MYIQSYDDRLCGLGKSSDTRKIINSSSERYLIVSPTIALNIEQHANIEGSQRIDSESATKGKTMKDRLEEALLNDTKVICTTHTSLKSILKHSDNKGLANSLSEVNLVIDEELTETIEPNSISVCKDSYPLLLSKIEIKPWSKNRNIYEVSAKDHAGIEEIAYGKSACDIIGSSGMLKKILRKVINPLYLTLIPKSSHDYFILQLKEKGWAQFSTISLLRADSFDRFRAVKTLSAYFPITEYALAMSFQGVKFRNATPQTSTTYRNSKRLHIHYLTDENWTKALRDRADCEEVTNITKVANFIKNELGGKSFIFNANTDDREIFSNIPNSRLVKETHGRNDLRGITNAVYMSSRNLSTRDGKLFEQMGISRGDIDTSRGILAGYQFFMRTALRDPTSKESVNIYCGDKRLTDFMLQVFPNAKVTKHEINLQFEKLDDKRKENGGKRSGAGRKSTYPNYFKEADKKAYRRYKAKTTKAMSADEWYAALRAEKKAA